MTGGTFGTDYTYSEPPAYEPDGAGILTVNSDTHLTISTSSGTASPANGSIVIGSGVTANITLAGLSIKPAENSTDDGYSGIDLASGATLNITLQSGSSNVINGGTSITGLPGPGIHVPEGSTLTIEGNGSLEVNGASTSNAAAVGIGGKGSDSTAGEACGNVLIFGGTITVQSGTATSPVGKSAGDIGGGTSDNGNGGNCSTVIILTSVNSNGNLEIGGGSGAAVGGGKGSDGSGIKPTNDGNYTVYGDLTLPCDVTIPAGTTVVIPEGASQTVPEGVTLTNNGTILVQGGTFTNNGTVNGNQPAYPSRVTVSFSQDGKPVASVPYGSTVTITATMEKTETAANALSADTGNVVFYLGDANDTTGTKMDTGTVEFEDGAYTASVDVTIDQNKGFIAPGTFKFTADFGGYAPEGNESGDSLAPNTGSAQLNVDESYTINYEEETITIAESFSLYEAESGGEAIFTSSGENKTASLKEYIQGNERKLYLQAPAAEGETAPDGREITIPARPAAPAAPTINYFEEKLSFSLDVTETTLEYALSQSDPNWQDVPSGAVLSGMGWNGDAEKTYYFRTGATDDSFASSPTTNPVTAPPRPKAPESPMLQDWTDVSLSFYVGKGVQCRLGNEGAWVTLEQGVQSGPNKITGMTTDMEYKLSTAEEWTECGGTEVTGLVAGDYQVRHKADIGGAPASEAVTVTVDKGEQDKPEGEIIPVNRTENSLSVSFYFIDSSANEKEAEIAYAEGLTADEPTSEWITVKTSGAATVYSAIIDQLSPGTPYVLFVRYKGNDYYNPSQPIISGTLYTKPEITTQSLPNAYVGVADSAQLEAVVAEGTTVSWSLMEGSSLPAGLTLSTDGIISGTPTAATPQTATFKVAATIGEGTSSTFSGTEFAITISRSEAELGNLTVSGNHGIAEGSFQYGDTITVTFIPQRRGDIATNALAENTAILTYAPDGGTPVELATATARADGSFELTYGTKEKKLPIGENLPLIVSYGGSDALNPTEKNVTVTLEQATLDNTPALSGNFVYGETLTADYTMQDDETVTYQWYRDNEKISGATGASYKLTAEDVGKRVYLIVSAADEWHSGSQKSVDREVAKASGSIEIACDSVTYGEAVAPSVTDTTNTDAEVTYSYVGTGDTSYGPSTEAPKDAGTYTVTATVAETATHTSATSESVSFSINRALLATPQNLSLTSNAPGTATAAWDAVPNASGYTVQPYKDGEAHGEPVVVTESGCEFSITEPGTHTVKVKANGSGNYADGTDAEASLTFFSVGFVTDDGGTVEPQVVAEGGKVTSPAELVKTGYTFGGWYSDDALTQAWDFDASTVGGATTL